MNCFTFLIFLSENPACRIHSAEFDTQEVVVHHLHFTLELLNNTKLHKASISGFRVCPLDKQGKKNKMNTNVNVKIWAAYKECLLTCVIASFTVKSGNKSKNAAASNFEKKLIKLGEYNNISHKSGTENQLPAMNHQMFKIHNAEDFYKITKGIKVAQCMQAKSSSGS